MKSSFIPKLITHCQLYASIGNYLGAYGLKSYKRGPAQTPSAQIGNSWFLILGIRTSTQELFATEGTRIMKDFRIQQDNQI